MRNFLIIAFIVAMVTAAAWGQGWIQSFLSTEDPASPKAAASNKSTDPKNKLPDPVGVSDWDDMNAFPVDVLDPPTPYPEDDNLQVPEVIEEEPPGVEGEPTLQRVRVDSDISNIEPIPQLV